MIQNKKGLSGIVTTLIIILLVLVATGIIWQVVGGLIESSTGKIKTSSLCMDIELKVSKIVGDAAIGNYTVTMKRTGSGSEEPIGAKIVFFNDIDGTDKVDFTDYLEPLETKTMSFSGSVINATSMEVTPYFIDEETGKDILCSTFEFEFKL